MNVEANAASDNWDKLFKVICENRYADVQLNDDEADLYDFDNAILMRRMRERLVETLQNMEEWINGLKFGNKFFMTMNKEQQRSFFHSIFNLEVRCIKIGEETYNRTESPAITISTPALLETLPLLHRGVNSLQVRNFALTRQSDVQALSNIILAKGETLLFLEFESIECPVDDCNKEDSDESDGFLDPLLYAASVSFNISLSTKTRPVHSSLISLAALRALFVGGIRFRRLLSLRGLGLTDSHVLAIVDGLSTPGIHLDNLHLESNPGITDQGYGALLNLINRTNAVGHVALCKWDAPDESCADKSAWEGKLNLVSEMNSNYGQLEYMTNGTFTSEEHKWQWLERLANLPRPYNDEEEHDAKHLNFIWYTLCQNPEMMRT